MRLDPEGALSFIRPDTVEERTKGKIWLPEETKEQEKQAKTTGVIMAIGPAAEIEFAKGPAEVGDHVIYVKYAGFPLKDTDTGEDYRIIDHKDYLARID